MITVWGGQTSRSIRVVWVLEEMGLPYSVRHVDMLAAEKDSAWLAVNPGDFLPAIQDGDVTMVESVAIMEYLMGRYGPTPLQPSPDDAELPDLSAISPYGRSGLGDAHHGPPRERLHRTRGGARQLGRALGAQRALSDGCCW